MKIFIDTAHVADIKEAVSLGYVAGVTTNPSLMAKEDSNPNAILRDICQIVEGPVSAEVIAVEAAEMIKEARELARIAPNIVIKIPMTRDGLKAVAVLKREGIPTNVTLVFSANQALLAARAGAAFVSPFVGRIDDMGQEGIKVVKEIALIFELHDISCQIIAASIRHPAHVTAAAMAGADIATIPFKVLDQMITHPLTEKGIAKFLSDWQKRVNH